ncbi:MAG: hypothetical protein JWM05_707 [Acidimicrobiales bacterium]|nr:hypothetical protein [Acidimicrobiales bacterium]
MSNPPIDDTLLTDVLRVTPWPDPLIDRLGHDPRSPYVELFWLGILGPSTTWLLRHLADGLDHNPDGYDLPLADTAKSLGLGTKGGRHSPFVRALGRTCQFKLAQPCGGDGLAVRRKLPPINAHQVRRLPAPLQDRHQAWLDAALQVPDPEQRRRRAETLALTLLELGEDIEATERQLHRWRFHPAMAHEAVHWALDRARPGRIEAMESDAAGSPAGPRRQVVAGLPSHPPPVPLAFDPPPAFD